MKSERKKQVMTLSILMVTVLAISIGFAAFSATLKINSSATVNPNASDFKVVFSSSENTLETGAIKASPADMGEDASINNAAAPTISGLMAKTRIPGDSVTYTFYVRNEGKYEAFLNSVSFGGKICVPGVGTNVEMANNACDSINAIVSVGRVQTSETKTDITGESLKPGESKQVTVTLSYDPNGARANGPFTVQFGDISMYYATANGINEDQSEIAYTGSIYRNSTENLYIGHYINTTNRWCAVSEFGSTCEYNDDEFFMVFNSEEECESTLGAPNELEEWMQELLANAVCEPGTLSYETTPLNINTNAYLKHEVVNNVVTASYACITYTANGTRKDTCLRGYDPTYYASNQSILRSVESYFNTMDYQYGNNGKGYCYFYDSYSSCYSDSLYLDAYSSGTVYANDGSSSCDVYSNGYSYCNE